MYVYVCVCVLILPVNEYKHCTEKIEYMYFTESEAHGYIA